MFNSFILHWHFFESPRLYSMQRIKSLDGLRGVAILLVIGFHYLNNQLIGAQAFYANLISRITYYGWVLICSLSCPGS